MRLFDGHEDWIRAQIDVRGPIEIAHERPWATVMRVPIASGCAWFKACAPIQAFEPYMTARLFERWPDRVSEVLAYDEARDWLLLADAGVAMHDSGNRPEEWLAVLPSYAELQRGESQYVADHLAHDVPDLRVETLPARYEELLRSELPLSPEEIRRLRNYADRFTASCHDLAVHGTADSVQHDDLHAWNVYRKDDRWRVLDWGDASISHPFMSLVVTFRFLEEANGLPPDDRWFRRLRDAYLEPWGPGLADEFAVAIRIGMLAHPLVELRNIDVHPPDRTIELGETMRIWRIWLQRALTQVDG